MTIANYDLRTFGSTNLRSLTSVILAKIHSDRLHLSNAMTRAVCTHTFIEAQMSACVSLISYLKVYTPPTKLTSSVAIERSNEGDGECLDLKELIVFLKLVSSQNSMKEVTGEYLTCSCLTATGPCHECTKSATWVNSSSYNSVNIVF